MIQDEKEPVLHVYSNRSILENKAGKVELFEEGKQSSSAQKRLLRIRQELEDDYFGKLIKECKNPSILDTVSLSDEHIKIIESLVNSVTSEVGRAVVALTAMQLVIKSIAPDQSIRLHKGSVAADFSWKEGVPMRVIDKNFITPTLRKYDLVRMNADGVMMTRSLAENYPYSLLYKASIRGAKTQWLQIVEALEIGSLDPLNALKCLIALLLNKTAEFDKIAQTTLSVVEKYTKSKPSFDEVFERIVNFVETSDYSARIFEISIHSLFQVFSEQRLLGGYLKPLSQMRSANKKHGNIGDIEITHTKGAFDIIESWDAKYGKSYLRDELEEINDKLMGHPTAELVGFVTNISPNLKNEIISRMDEIADFHSLKISILSFKEWVELQFQRFSVDNDATAQAWLTAIAESICQRRRSIAPIDEPTAAWVLTLAKTIQ